MKTVILSGAVGDGDNHELLVPEFGAIKTIHPKGAVRRLLFDAHIFTVMPHLVFRKKNIDNETRFGYHFVHMHKMKSGRYVSTM